MPIIIGIDPGKTGGIVSLSAGGEIIDMRVMPFNSEERTDTFVFKRMNTAKIFIEKAQVFPKNGAVGMYNYGKHYGAILGAFDAFGIPFTEVPPRTWTGMLYKALDAHEYTSKGKEMHYLLAHRLWPSISFLATPRSTKPHEGLVDAALIAYYGYLVYCAAKGKI